MEFASFRAIVLDQWEVDVIRLPVVCSCYLVNSDGVDFIRLLLVSEITGSLSCESASFYCDVVCLCLHQVIWDVWENSTGVSPYTCFWDEG